MNVVQIALLLLLGVGVGIAFPERLTPLFGPTTLYVVLPALIFEACWSLDAALMRAHWRPIALLAFPGVLITVAIVGVAVSVIAHVPIGIALLLGAVLSATDPVAVVAIFRRVSVPRPLATIVESESLLNDAVAVVVYRSLIAAVALGFTAQHGARIAGYALLGVVLAIGLGVALAYAAAFVVRSNRGVPAQLAATFIGAYAAYFEAEHLGWSGIFAVIAFAIALRQIEKRAISVSIARDVDRAWRWASVLGNAVLFFLTGAALDLTRLTHEPVLIVTTLAVVFVARVTVAFGLLQAVRPRIRLAWLAVVQLAGMRGALSLALALAIPAAIVYRAQIVDATFAVVIVTVLAGSLTIDRGLRGLRL